MEGDRIVGADFATKAAVRRISARIVIDATGDGDVAFRAGAPCELGDPARSGAMQPATTFFRICGLPEAAVEAVRTQYPQDGLCFKTLVTKARAEGRWTLPRPERLFLRQTSPLPRAEAASSQGGDFVERFDLLADVRVSEV